MKDIDKAISRNLDELTNATLKRRALKGIADANSSHALDFFVIAKHALSNDIRSHIMKVFDKHKDTASFWICINNCRKEFTEVSKEYSIDLKRIESISEKFKIIRDKTHFHIDKKAVLDPKKIYEEANVTYDDLDYLLEFGFKILNSIYEIRGNIKKEIAEYDGSDVPKIIKSYKERHPNIPIYIGL